MRSCHGGSRDVVSGRGGSNPSGDDVLSRSEYVNNGTVVGEGCTSIGDGGCSDGYDLGGTSGRSGAGVRVGVSGGDDDVNTSVDSLLYQGG